MKTGSIKIEGETVIISPVKGTVWLTQHQIADFFNVFVGKIGSNIRSIFNNDYLDPDDVKTWYESSGTENIVVLYNLEMITALSYRIKSREADLFRRWVAKR